MKRMIKNKSDKRGSVLVMVVVALMIMTAFGVGMLAIAYGTRQQAIKEKNENAALLAAEAGYEKAVFWMSQQQDMLTTLYNGSAGTSGTLNFTQASCNYNISFYSFVKARPVYRIISVGHSGPFDRTVNTLVMQAISGWAMGKCRIPTGATSTSAVNYVDGEIIDMPLQINKLIEGMDERDIYIIGDPQFLQPVSMGESRYTTGGADKYAGVMNLFQQGITFNQPDSRVVDEDTVQSKVNRFRDSTAAAYRFTPAVSGGMTNALPAVHLEFFVDTDNIGKVRITNNCTVKGFKQNYDSKTYDFKIVPGSDGSRYQRYDIYSYHVRPSDADATGQRVIRQIDQTYVTQSFGGVESTPGGQIYIDGNVIIGSAGDSDLPGNKNVVKDKVTVVATGNIWIANKIEVDGDHNVDGKPSSSNANVLGLISKGVIKVVDPGMSRNSPTYQNPYPGPPTSVPSDTVYVPVANRQSSSSNVYDRLLPHDMVIEAALTVGGGGWGAENVNRGSYGGRREFVNGQQDNLIVRGAITEACRGVVGVSGSGSEDGYLKYYYLDSRLLEGVLPGDFWLQGKYIPAPAGWHDYRN
ncbi:MAG: hypothetical protein ABFD79_18570 [Phycisphaerales bacterium]